MLVFYKDIENVFPGFHWVLLISTPLKSWQNGNPRNHHDHINPIDLPELWLNLDITVEVEAKAKELAVLKLINDIQKSLKSSETHHR
jgi:UV DNA damage repair endonuclease